MFSQKVLLSVAIRYILVLVSSLESSVHFS